MSKYSKMNRWGRLALRGLGIVISGAVLVTMEITNIALAHKTAGDDLDMAQKIVINAAAGIAGFVLMIVAVEHFRARRREVKGAGVFPFFMALLCLGWSSIQQGGFLAYQADAARAAEVRESPAYVQALVDYKGASERLRGGEMDYQTENRIRDERDAAGAVLEQGKVRKTVDPVEQAGYAMVAGMIYFMASIIAGAFYWTPARSPSQRKVKAKRSVKGAKPRLAVSN